MDFEDHTLAEFAENDLRELWDTDCYADELRAASELDLYGLLEGLGGAGQGGGSTSGGAGGVVLQDRLIAEASLGVMGQLSTLSSLTSSRESMSSLLAIQQQKQTEQQQQQTEQQLKSEQQQHQNTSLHKNLSSEKQEKGNNLQQCSQQTETRDQNHLLNASQSHPRTGESCHELASAGTDCPDAVTMATAKCNSQTECRSNSGSYNNGCSRNTKTNICNAHCIIRSDSDGNNSPRDITNKKPNSTPSSSSSNSSSSGSNSSPSSCSSSPSSCCSSASSDPECPSQSSERPTIKSEHSYSMTSEAPSRLFGVPLEEDIENECYPAVSIAEVETTKTPITTPASAPTSHTLSTGARIVPSSPNLLPRLPEVPVPSFEDIIDIKPSWADAHKGNVVVLKTENEYMELDNDSEDDNFDSDNDSDEDMADNFEYDCIPSPRSWNPKSSLDISALLDLDEGDSDIISSCNNLAAFKDIHTTCSDDIKVKDDLTASFMRENNETQASNVSSASAVKGFSATVKTITTVTRHDLSGSSTVRVKDATCPPTKNGVVSIIGKPTFIHTVGKADALESGTKENRRIPSFTTISSRTPHPITFTTISNSSKLSPTHHPLHHINVKGNSTTTPTTQSTAPSTSSQLTSSSSTGFAPDSTFLLESRTPQAANDSDFGFEFTKVEHPLELEGSCLEDYGGAGVGDLHPTEDPLGNGALESRLSGSSGGSYRSTTCSCAATDSSSSSTSTSSHGSCHGNGAKCSLRHDSSCSRDSEFCLPPTPPSYSSSDSDCSGLSPPRTSPLYESLPLQLNSPRRPHHRHTASVRHPIHTPLISSQPKGATGTLYLTEEEKRTLVSEGYPVPTKLPLTKAEEKSLKKIRRKIKNKISAQESRRKKKEYMDQLERKVDDLAEENRSYRRHLDALTAANHRLTSELRALKETVARQERGTIRSTPLAAVL